MAKFGIEQTGLSSPSLSGASFISQGVQDNSGALRTQATTGLIKNVGEMGIDAYKGYQIADVEAEQEKVIQDYMDRRNPEQLKIEAAGLETQRASMLLQGVPEEEVNPVTAKMRETLARYQKAKDQGLMTPEDFTDRTLSVLRTATNRNPGLFKELSDQASKVLQLSGITDVVKSDQLVQKSQQEKADAYIKDLYARAKEQDIFYTSTTPIYEIEQQLQVAETDKRNYTLQLRAKDRKDMFTAGQALDWVATNGDSSVRGGLSNFGSTLSKIAEVSQASPTEYSKIKANATLAGIKAKDAFLESIPVEIRNNPTVIQKIESFNKGIDTTLTMLEGLGSGEDWKKAVNNHLEITKIGQDQRIRDTVDVAAIDLTMNILKADPSFFAVSDPARKSVYNTLLQLQSGNYSAPIIDQQMPKTMKENSLSRHIDSSAILGKETGSYEGLNKILDTFNAKTLQIQDPNQKYVFLAKNLESLSKADLSGAKSDTVSKVKTMVDNFLHDPTYGLPDMFSKVEKYGVTVDVLPDGRIQFLGNEANKFNSKYGIAVNNALGAYANSQGITTKEAAKKFYPEYFDKYISGTTTETPNKRAENEMGSLDKKAEALAIKAKAQGADTETIARLWRKPLAEVEAFFKRKEEEIKASMRKTTGR